MLNYNMEERLIEYKDIYDIENNIRNTDSSLENKLNTSRMNKTRNRIINNEESEEIICCYEICYSYFKCIIKFYIYIFLLGIIIYIIVTFALKKIPFQ